MSGKKIILRADTSSKIGYGHFIRSLALAGYLKDRFECHFASYNHEGLPLAQYQLEEIERSASLVSITGNSLEEFNRNFLRTAKNYDIVVLDNYFFTTKYQEDICDMGCKLVCIDDMHDRRMHCHLLMTPCPLQRGDFLIDSSTRFAGGLEWAFLRDAFLAPTSVKHKSVPAKNIVIAMGGADPFRLTEKIAEIVVILIPAANINIIAGNTAIISEQTKEFASIHQNISAETIANLYDTADLGILSASTVCLEAFSRHLPVAAGYYVDNQADFYRYGVEHNLFAPLGCLLDSIEDITVRLKKVLSLASIPTPGIDFSHQKQKILELFESL